jgi:hypothetical protein
MLMSRPRGVDRGVVVRLSAVDEDAAWLVNRADDLKQHVARMTVGELGAFLGH